MHVFPNKANGSFVCKYQVEILYGKLAKKLFELRWYKLIYYSSMVKKIIPFSSLSMRMRAFLTVMNSYITSNLSKSIWWNGLYAVVDNYWGTPKIHEEVEFTNQNSSTCSQIKISVVLWKLTDCYFTKYAFYFRRFSCCKLFDDNKIKMVRKSEKI